MKSEARPRRAVTADRVYPDAASSQAPLVFVGIHDTAIARDERTNITIWPHVANESRIREQPTAD